MNEYNHLNIPKTKYNFSEKSNEVIIEQLKSGTLSKDATSVGLYILEYERHLQNNDLEEIRSKILESNDNELFQSFGLQIIENNKSINLEFKKTNRRLLIAVFSFLIILYLFFILPFSIIRILEQDYFYVFGPLIFLFPYLIFKTYESFKRDNNFNLKIDQQKFTINSKGTEFKEFIYRKEEVIDLKIIDSSNFELKLIAEFKDHKQIEILTEQYSNFSEKKARLYFNKIKEKLYKHLF